MMPAADLSFDPDFASPSDWAAMYRSCGLQVVPAYMPKEGTAWKRPQLANWTHYQEELAPDATFARWYGSGGQYEKHKNLGVITGRASENLVVIDLDTHAKDEARLWWEGQLVVNNYGAEPETWKQRTGGGGRQVFFRAPTGWQAPTNKTGIGVDVRGQGGFAMLPPSLHISGKEYEWEPGCEPWSIDLAIAPDWLLEAVDALVEQHGGHKPGEAEGPHERTSSPTTDFDAFWNRIDGREDAMRDRVWRAVLEFKRAGGVPGTDAEKLAFEDALLHYLQRTRTRIPNVDNVTGLERECRGPSAFYAKWQRAMRQWDGKVAAEAAKPNPRAKAEPEPEKKAEQAQQAEGIRATPFRMVDPKTIEPRRWVYGRHYIRKFLSVTISAGGIGKSSLTLAEALAMVTGQPLLGIAPEEVARVWAWNGEDPAEELQRRIGAAAIRYKLTQDDIGDRLFVDTGRLMPIVIAEQTRDGARLAVPVVEAVTRTIIENRIDVMIVDPFVSSHAVTENDNNAIERVAKTWGQIADATNCAIDLVHHSRKTGGAEVTVEDGRGASALLAAARSARVLNVMTEEEAQKAGVENRKLYFKLENGKANLAPPPEGATWFYMVGVDIGNGNGIPGSGDNVGVVTEWQWPDHTADVTAGDMLRVRELVGSRRCRADAQSPDWVGLTILEVLGLEATPANKAKAKSLQKMWCSPQSRVLEEYEDSDDRRRSKRFVRPGPFND